MKLFETLRVTLRIVNAQADQNVLTNELPRELLIEAQGIVA
jgi:hypothetical protein